jgi:acetolactate synthase-1/2/3 large subunit
MDARSTSNTQTHSAAYFLLEGLNEIGVDYLFCNFGTDHAPIIEELANRKQRGEPVPKTIRCAHENTAAHMAAGYALMTGRGQGVLVHVDVGTANTATAMHNLFRSRLPVLLMAGKAPFTAAHELTGTRDTYVHFVQEPFDQGSLVRPYVKWEWTLPSGVVVKEALRRAHTIMQSEPRGPVYLMMARETLAQEWDEADMRRYSAEQFGGAAQGAADPELIAQLAARIEAAQNPMLITAYAGRNPDASRAIEELAEFAGIAVYESNFVNNISHEGPCFLGFVPDKHLPEADLGLLVDIDVPWFPRDVQQKEGSYWAQIDVDVLKTASPMWTFPSNLRLQGDSARILTQLLARLKEIATPKFREAAAARVKSFESVRTARIERAKQLASDKGKPDEINPHYLFAELAKLIEPTDIVFNEAVRNSGALALQIPRRRRARLVRRHGARRQARGAGPHDGAGGGRRQLLLQLPELGVRGGEAIQAAVPLDRARQHRLVGGEGIDPAGVSRRQGQGDQGVRGRAVARRRLRQGRRGVRRPWREGARPRRGAGRAQALRRRRARRPRRAAARAGDADLKLAAGLQ